MKNKGWIKVVAEDDKRAHPFRLTDAGASLLKQVIPAWENAQKVAEESIGQSGVDWLLRGQQ